MKDLQNTFPTILSKSGIWVLGVREVLTPEDAPGEIGELELEEDSLCEGRISGGWIRWSGRVMKSDSGDWFLGRLSDFVC